MIDLPRRGFLKIAGLTLLGLAAKPAWEIYSSAGESPRKAAVARAKKWAMAVDLKRCWAREGCKDCIVACHTTHNVPNLGTVKEEVRWIWTAPFEDVFSEQVGEYSGQDYGSKPVPLFCNHCDDPPCVRYCPTRATWKREDGIVMMDFHRCIGCRYCMAGCPYSSRSFNWRDPRPFIKRVNIDFPTRTKGVVEKCNFCEERLERRQVPACVEACKERALIFGDLNDGQSELRGAFLHRITYQRQPELGTRPKVFYLL